jgi:hypothetical protein
MTTRQTQALCVLDSWLTASGIEHTIQPTNPEVKVRTKDKSAYLEYSVSDLDLQSLLSTDPDLSLPEFHTLTQPAGYGKPIPVSRQHNFPKGNAKDFFLTIIRHKEFRNAPDLDNDTIKKYHRIITNCAYAFKNRHYQILQDMGIEFKELYHWGLIWAHNFHHKYRALFASEETNQCYLAQHIKQRFGNALVFIEIQHKNSFVETSRMEEAYIPEPIDLEEELACVPPNILIPKLIKIAKSKDPSVKELAQNLIRKLTQNQTLTDLSV